MGITVRYTSRFGVVEGGLQKNATDVVRDAANACAQFAINISPVRTGALKSSWYVSGPNQESDYSSAADFAERLNPLAIIMDEATADLVEPDLKQPVAIISSAVNYAIFLEEGTRYMAPQPILTPAAEVARTTLLNGMKGIADI